MVSSPEPCFSLTVLLFWRSFIGVRIYLFLVWFYFIFRKNLFPLAVLGLHEFFFLFFAVVAHWYWSVEGLLVQCCVAWPQVAIWGFTFAVITEPRRGHGVFACSPTRVYPCRVYSSECWRRRLTLIGEACSPRVRVWRTVFTPSRRDVVFFGVYIYIFVASSGRSCIFHSFQNKVRRWRMFRGGVWWKSLKGRIRIHLPCHASPPKKKNLLKAYSANLNSYEKAQPTLFGVLCCGCILSYFFFWGFVLSRVHPTFSQPPSSKLASSDAEKKRAAHLEAGIPEFLQVFSVCY